MKNAPRRTPTSFRRFVQLGAVLLFIMTSGCGTVRMAYDNSDWILVRYADSYLDLDNEQRQLLRTGMRQRLADHRQYELRHLVDYLDAVAEAIRDGLTAARLNELMECGQALYETTVVNTIPVVTPVLVSLRPGQINHLADRMDQENREYREKYLQDSLEERLAGRADRVVDAVESWTGNLDAGQRQLVAHLSRGWPDVSGDWYAYRVDRQQKFLSLLRQRATLDDVDRFLTEWWLGRAPLDPTLDAKTRRLVDGVQTMVLAVDQGMSREQRRRVLKRVEGLRDDLAALLPKKAPRTARLSPHGLAGLEAPYPGPACAG